MTTVGLHGMAKSLCMIYISCHTVRVFALHSIPQQAYDVRCGGPDGCLKLGRIVGILTMEPHVPQRLCPKRAQHMRVELGVSLGGRP